MDLRERRLTPDDLPACLALSDEAGWNQTAADWQMLLEIGEGIGLFRNGRLVATAGVAVHGGRIGWICMVLVTQAERRQGLATRLLRWAMELCEARGLVAGLDATPAGKQVYARLGFRVVDGIKRLERGLGQLPTGPAAVPDPDRDRSAREPGSVSRPDVATPSEDAAACGVRPVGRAQIATVAAYDLPRFGTDRTPIIARWLDWRGDLAYQAVSAGRVRGYCLAREGRHAIHVGPAVADDDATAIAVLEAVLRALSGPACIDVPDRHQAVIDWLLEQGFTYRRPFARMLAGGGELPGRRDSIYALAGPEFS